MNISMWENIVADTNERTPPVETKKANENDIFQQNFNQKPVSINIQRTQMQTNEERWK